MGKIKSEGLGEI
jgi:aldehyde dehydrogenase family 7 protein A1